DLLAQEHRPEALGLVPPPVEAAHREPGEADLDRQLRVDGVADVAVRVGIGPADRELTGEAHRDSLIAAPLGRPHAALARGRGRAYARACLETIDPIRSPCA